ncbi:hypothetical protein CQU01_22030 [Cerasibacillus quisquiliarum]|uniref:Uncharacterized protein n=1 Tax=Cerasibacillus quisquiliarum TaxID=227865 RepID=A0A511UZ89_9BACI|nr:hypothetical protein CQU01_22030 [Cerasibacillus quisquiliarum]
MFYLRYIGIKRNRDVLNAGFSKIYYSFLYVYVQVHNYMQIMRDLRGEAVGRSTSSVWTTSQT